MAEYKQIPLEEALPGMVLSDDVLDMQGHVLLAKGVALTAMILAALRHHQVALLPIVSGKTSEKDREKELSMHEARLKRLFRKRDTDGDDATGLLERHMRRFRLGDQA